mmetsp:Transcript_2096/g.4861  ORF Transcript_2096/g.4861 Transcript_2096/m.4861 type:complete len:245 (-) Transcript_2096:3655-4389(-)
MSRLSVTKLPKTTKVMKYSGAVGLPQHSPMAQSTWRSHPESTMQSYMTLFHASPVAMRTSRSRAWPKLRKLACSFMCSPYLILPKRCMPRTAYTKHSRNISAPMLSKPGREMMRVLNSMRRPLSLRTSRNTRASRRMRSTLVPPPLPAMNPISVVAMQKKSKQFHRWAKYTVGYMAYSLSTASKTNTAAKKYDTPLSALVRAMVCWYCSHAIAIALSTMMPMMNHSKSSASTSRYTALRCGSSG